jgi:pimeloyl-ACP methyl ester carboxylesterase
MPVDGHRLHVVSLGQGEPVVLLESAIAASSVSWARVQPEVARFTRVIAYDRAGLAWSDAATEPRTIASMCEEMRRLLATIGNATPAPAVLVGHSFGALLCLAFTVRNPVWCAVWYWSIRRVNGRTWIASARGFCVAGSSCRDSVRSWLAWASCAPVSLS